MVKTYKASFITAPAFSRPPCDIGNKGNAEIYDTEYTRNLEPPSLSRQSFFGRYFKKHTGMSPLKYRKL